MTWKLRPLVMLVALAAFISIGLYSSSEVKASVTGISSDANDAPGGIFNSGDEVEITVDLTADTEDIDITVNGGDFTGVTVTDCDPDCADDGEADLGNGNASVTVNADNVTEITLSIVVTCSDDETITITAAQNVGDANNSLDLTCQAGGGGFIGGSGQVIAEADPNLLPCKGGTSEISAKVIDLFGDEIEGLGFHFSTTAGLIEETSNTTADLKLGPGQLSATVTVSVFDPPNDPDEDGEIKSATVTVSLDCNNFVSVVVTASPNVIQCGGTSVLTATARDANGHVVDGVGFHFATNTGLLVVNPNNAKTDKGIATLSLVPGMPDSTVNVSVGTAQGTVEGTITVQNFCPGVQVGQDASAAQGLIALNSSANTLGCNETVFIGARVMDSKNQIVPDGTIVNFVTNKGTLIPPSAATVNGVLNIGFQAKDSTNGNPIGGAVTVTAASGDKFGTVNLQVNCTGGSTATNGAGAGPAPCVPIGDGICISPPNTGGGGTRITPPSTGDGGIR